MGEVPRSPPDEYVRIQLSKDAMNLHQVVKNRHKRNQIYNVHLLSPQKELNVSS